MKKKLFQGKPYFAKVRSSNSYVVVTVATAFLVDAIAYSIVTPIIPFALSALEHGESITSAYDMENLEIESDGNFSQKLGAFLALFSVGATLGSFVFGAIGGRLKSRRGSMLVGMIGFLLSYVLFLLSKKYWELLLARFIQGFSSASIWTEGLCLISDTFALKKIATMMSRTTVFFTIGLAVGIPIGGALYHASGYRAPFVFCISITFLNLLQWFLLVERKDSPPEWFEEPINTSQVTIPGTSKEIVLRNSTACLEKASEILELGSSNENEVTFIDTTIDSGEEKKRGVSYLTLLKENRLLAGMILVYAETFIDGLLESTLSLRLASEWKYDSSEIGLVYIASMGPYIIGNLISGIVTDKYGPKVLVYATWTICAIATCLNGIPKQNTPGGIVPLIFLLIIQGFTISCFMVPVLADIGHIANGKKFKGSHEALSKGYSLINAAYSIGGTAGPLLGGVLYQKIGFFYLWLLTGCFFIVVAPYVLYFVGGKGYRFKNQETRLV